MNSITTMNTTNQGKAYQSRAIRNNNPLNIVKGSRWKGLAEDQTDSRFCKFVSRSYGWRAALILLRNYIEGRTSSKRKYDSISSIISRWAPPSENATQAYILNVSRATGIHYLKRLVWTDRKEICSICQAMAKVESGTLFDIDEIYAVYDLIK